ncbi:uncharacterized protein BX664DRAFT_267896 [Halteromyces radiatus]|uniref:uncharacterized protein n=1 Tax=Halteromyces radiatus TaxID=101107 RepID=UPI00221FE549|nr:uncharacterized protein BX664DRAFT_267896 [Halteromyces radiatus]KAI8083076.1 hypothetical protein BX664DRAFT_267896 [Halteromyces radiatus]
MSTVSISPTHHDVYLDSIRPSISFYQHAIESDPNVSISKNTYFMDGGHRFISVPMLGNTNTKAGSGISRLFEEWLASKLYSQPVLMDDQQRLPILQDHVELVAEDILNKMKQSSWKGLDKIMIKVRTGHVYTYHSCDGQPLITQDMEDLFQQFPLFVEFFVYTTSSDAPSTQLLLIVENVTINPGNPYKLMEAF